MGLKERVDRVLEGYVIDIGTEFDSYEQVGDFSGELLEAVADFLAESETHATVTIAALRDAAYTLRKSLASLGTTAEADEAGESEWEADADCENPTPDGPCTKANRTRRRVRGRLRCRTP